MKADIVVSKIDESKVFVDCSNSIAQELSDYFSAYAQNYRFAPLYKMGKWDGRIRSFSLQTNHLPIGLLDQLKVFADKAKYSLHIDFETQYKVDQKEFLSFVKSLSLPFDPRDFQLQAAYDAICNKHLNISSSTSSGKSLIIYIIARWMMSKEKKTLLICTTTQLVEQMFGDFLDYGFDEVEDKCCRIYAGKKRLVHKPIIISTYQSLYSDIKKDKSGEDYIDFDQIDCLIIDESHSAKAVSISTVCRKTSNAEYRIGVSGTYPDPHTADWLTIVGGTGPIQVYSTYKTLQDNKQISNLKINAITLEYPNATRSQNFKINNGDYSKESSWINDLPERTEFISKLTQNLKGNVLLLFTKIESGKALFNHCKQHLKDKRIFYIDGSKSVDEREYIRRCIEAYDNCVLVASYGTTSTGINLKRLHHLIFCSGYKSKIKNLQSIGRILRLSVDKVIATLWDIVDDMRIKFKEGESWKTYTNFAMKHAKERDKIYREQGFEIYNKKYQIKLKMK